MAGREIGSTVLPDLPDSMTVRELVRLRVREEVARFNGQDTLTFQGLVQPTDAEVVMNGYRLKARRRIDWEKQADLAEEAFGRNGFIVFVGERQVEDLDEVVDLNRDHEMAFVKLVPLVGG